MAILTAKHLLDKGVIDLRAESNQQYQQSVSEPLYTATYKAEEEAIWSTIIYNSSQSHKDIATSEEKTRCHTYFTPLIAVYVGGVLVVIITIHFVSRHLFLSHKTTTHIFTSRRFINMLTRNRAGLEDIFERLGLSREVNKQECMRYEILRLHTFHNWPRASPVFPTQLASSGFYYIGYHDEVECFRCQGRIVQWDRGDNPHEEHRRLFPNCPMVTGRDDLNVPLEIREGMDRTRIAEVLRVPLLYSWSRDRTTISTSENLLNSSTPPETLSSGNGQLGSDRSQNQTQRSISPGQTEISESHTEASRSHNENSETTNVTRSDRSGNQEAAVGRSVSSGETTLDSLAIQQSSGPSSYSTRGVMKIEQNRLNTFRQWPKRQRIEPRLMSAAGLYFVGPNDKVKCAFCEGAMMNWDAGDDPHDEHFRYFGDRCAFIRGEEVGNVPLPGSNPNTSSRRTPRGMSSNQARTFEQLGIVTDRPRQPTMAREADRLATFGSWPRNKQQTPESLAQAGFYFTGLNDQVRCFFCDVGLRNWEPQDEPWTEHARWFPKCGFLKQTKGAAFIHEANRNAALVQPGSSVNRNNPEDNGGTPTRPESTTEFDPRLVAAQMSTNKVQLVLNMGFPRAQVKSVIENRLRTTGQPFPSAEGLLDAVMGSSDQSVPAASAPAPGLAEQRPAAVEMQQSSGSEGDENGTQTPAGAMNGHVTAGHAEEQTRGEGGSNGSNATKKKRKRNRKKKNGTSSNQERQGEREPSPANSNEDTLIQENQMLRDQRLCKICLDNESEVVFLPCGHLVSCSSCAPNLRNCPMCRALIRGTVKAFMS